MSTLYKIYTSVLMERVKEELEGKEIIPDNQTRFRKRMGVMDNIYVLNYLINKKLKAKKTLVAIFVDLKACFDSLDGKLIEEAMEKKGIRKGLRVRVAEIFKETKSRVKVGEKVGDCFWLAREVRQGCPINLMLFNILIADLEEEMRKKRWGGIKMGTEKISTLAYADDLVLLSEDEEEMTGLISGLEKYLDRKNLTLKVNKTKAMRFIAEKRHGRPGGKEKKLEEVKEFKYL